MMLLALVCCVMVITCVSSKCDQQETELSRMKQWISDLEEENYRQKQALEDSIDTLRNEIFNHKKTLNKQQDAIDTLTSELLNTRKGQQLASDTAFSAFDDSGNVYYGNGEVFPFRIVHLNQGNNYDAETRTYICPVTGIYFFSTQNLANGGDAMELEIVVGGTSTAGLHVGDNGGGSDPTATVITQYNQGDSVQVKAMQIGAWRWGRYGNMWVSAFSGTLLALL